MGWIKNKLNKIFYKEPNAPVHTTPIIVDPVSEKFDFDKWNGKFADLSHWEEHFDINNYPCPILLNKCTDALSFIDNTHAPRKEACAKKGIIYGGYHFWSCFDDPIKQANFYFKTHGSFTINPILDFETNKTQNNKDLKKSVENAYIFLCEIERIVGRTPVIYMNPSIASFCNFDMRFARFPLWLAKYGASQAPLAPKPWPRYFAWQFTESGPMQGQEGNCDVNIYDKKIDLFNLKEKKI